MVKTLSKFIKIFNSNHYVSSDLPGTIGHLVWPMEIYSWVDHCSLCNSRLMIQSDSICELHGNHVHETCYRNLGVTGIELLVDQTKVILNNTDI